MGKQRSTQNEVAGTPRKSRSSVRRPSVQDIDAQDPDQPREAVEQLSFSVVGLGASAGGLEAFQRLLEHLPGNTGMAYVFIQHLAPAHDSKLAELLARSAKIPIIQIEDGVAVQPNHGYVIPPSVNLAISHGVLHLMPRPAGRLVHLPIDYFFHSLAEDQGNRAIGIVLSGNASDGTLGLEAIKAAGGITFAQDEQSAKYTSMPHSAISTDSIVDFILPPEQIARELTRIAPNSYVRLVPKLAAEEQIGDNNGSIDKMFILLRTATGVDFSYYKQSTIRRRILRRLILHKLDNLQSYVHYLQQDKAELQSLYNDLLIHVTSFFRDPEAFESLAQKILPQIIRNRQGDMPIRVWVPACSSGEEVYSIAITLLEALGDSGAGVSVQIFATDVNESNIERARAGIYTEAVTANIPPALLQRYFTQTTGGYQIHKRLRDMVFARQNLIRDPPFSRLDLISCRNLLIYFGPALQKKVLPMLHYALKPGGFLMLGTSETVGTFADLFALVDKKNKIYSKKMSLPLPKFDAYDSSAMERSLAAAGKADMKPATAADIQHEADRVVLTRYAPAGVLINADFDILQFRGHTGPFLEPAAGAASLNLLKMAREGLTAELRAALHKAKSENITVRREGLRMAGGKGFKTINIEIIPLLAVPVSQERCLLVLFEDAYPEPAFTGAPDAVPKTKQARQVAKDPKQAQLEQELIAAKEYLQSVIEEQEAANEELQSTNQELQSSNEELQTTNEELETTKEELQSSHEELTTLNEELQSQNIELSMLNNDLNNLLLNVNIPILMLSNDLRIRRFTPQAERLLNLIPTDVERPISDIQPNIIAPQLEAQILGVIDTLATSAQDVQDRSGRWYNLRIQPYRTIDNKIDGAVLTLLGVEESKLGMEEALVTSSFVQPIMEMVAQPLLCLDEQLRLTLANQAFYHLFKLEADTAKHSPLFQLNDGAWDKPALRACLETILRNDKPLEDIHVEHEFPALGQRTLHLYPHQLRAEGKVRMILIAVMNSEKRE